MEIRIRRAEPADADVIVGFNLALAAETEDVDLDRAVLEPGVRTALADEERCRYWVAEREGRVVGQTMVTYEWSDWRNGFIWWIQSVYVDPEARSSGVFKALHRYVLDEARAEGAVGVRLYVYGENERAQEVYRRLGMIEPGYHVLETMFGE